MNAYVAVVGSSSPATAASSITNGVQAQTATLAYTDTVAKALFTIPDGAIILQWIINVTTVFNDSGTDQVNIGVSGTAAKYASALDVSTTGLKTAYVLTQIGIAQSGAQAVLGIYAGQNSNATTGAMTITAIYQTP